MPAFGQLAGLDLWHSSYIDGLKFMLKIYNIPQVFNLISKSV